MLFRSRLKKKIAGVFEQDKAYRILTESRFVSSHDKDLVVIKIPESIELTETQYRILNRQADSVYGEGNSFIEYIQIKSQTSKEQRVSREKITLQEEARKKEVQSYITAIDTATIWGKIRKSLIEYLNQDGKDGIALDKSWFSKLAGEIDEGGKKLILKAPGNFIKDYVQQKYGRMIERYSYHLNYRFVNYNSNDNSV